MEVILREEIDQLGRRGDVVNVAAGYARNYLLPKRLAVAATEGNKKIIEQERQAHLRRDAKEQTEAADLGQLLEGTAVTSAHKAGENDQLFRALTAWVIAHATERQQISIARRKNQHL